MSFPPEQDERSPYGCLIILALAIIGWGLFVFALGKLLATISG